MKLRSLFSIVLVGLVGLLLSVASVLYAGTTWTNSNPIDLDTHAIYSMDYEHHEIHAGSSYTVFYALTTAATDAHRTGIYFRTPVDKEIHPVAAFAASTAE